MGCRRIRYVIINNLRHSVIQTPVGGKKKCLHYAQLSTTGLLPRIWLPNYATILRALRGVSKMYIICWYVHDLRFQI